MADSHASTSEKELEKRNWYKARDWLMLLARSILNQSRFVYEFLFSTNFFSLVLSLMC